VIGFGGFRYRDGGVQALFASATRNPKSPTYPDLDPTRPLAELSSAGGRIWRPGALGCPPAGPCLILGPYLPGDCAKGTAWQPLLRSMDGGVRWLQPPLPDRVQPCSAAQLLAISAQDALLVNSSSPFPLTRTTNGGATWEDIALPAVPGAPPYPFGLVPGGITALPDGDLLLTGQQPRWHLLRRGAKTWCAVHIPPARIQALPQVSSLTLIGRELWWLTGSFGAPGARHIAASAIAC
jgi:hypothetical protein